MTTGRHIAQEDLALYAMQAFSSEESAELRLHLDNCETCSVELAKVAGDLALVALSVEQQPLPEGARQRFMDRIGAAPAPARKADSTEVQEISTGPGFAARFGAWVPWVAVAALLVIAISLEIKATSLDHQLKIESQRLAGLSATAAHAQEVADLLTAPAAQRVVLTTGKAPVAPTGRAVYLPERGALIFQANNLAQLDESKTYELWVIPANGGAPIPAGLFRPDATGSASVVLPPLPTGVPAKAFGVTVEKAEGSTTPTAPILLAGAAPTPGV